MALMATSTFFLAGITPALAGTHEPQKPPAQSQETLPPDPDMMSLPPIEPPDWLPPMEPLTPLPPDELSTPLPEKFQINALPPSHLPAPPMPPDAKIVDPAEKPQKQEHR